jgi:hypothetical protein
VIQYHANGRFVLVCRETSNRAMGITIPGGTGGQLVVSPIVNGRIASPSIINLP